MEITTTISARTFAEEMASLNIDPIEYSRQSGRTHRMMEAAKALCEKGKPVVVIFKDEMLAKLWRAKYKDVNGLSVIPMSVNMPDLDWKQLKMVSGPYAFHQTFLDHDTIFSYQKELIREYHKYDRVMDTAPYNPLVLDKPAE
jgi:hypothetical protein